jgi:hypothetical protein
LELNKRLEKEFNVLTVLLVCEDLVELARRYQKHDELDSTVCEHMDIHDLFIDTAHRCCKTVVIIDTGQYTEEEAVAQLMRYTA